MGASRRKPVPRPTRAKPPSRRRTVSQKRERILRERVTYMLWIMANRVD